MKSKFIDGDDLVHLRRHMDNEAWLVFRLMLETGLRVGDAVSLKRKDVKPDGLHYVAQKTGKSGVAAITPGLRRALLARKAGWLFPGRKPGSHITRQAVWARIKTACKRASVDAEGVSPHAMRKVFAVELYREKGFEAVKAALQHEHRDTSEIYAFADWNTGENAELPLRRRDIDLIVKMVLEAVGERLYAAKDS